MAFWNSTDLAAVGVVAVVSAVAFGILRWVNRTKITQVPGTGPWLLGQYCTDCGESNDEHSGCCPECGSLNITKKVYRWIWDGTEDNISGVSHINRRKEFKDVVS